MENLWSRAARRSSADGDASHFASRGRSGHVRGAELCYAVPLEPARAAKDDIGRSHPNFRSRLPGGERHLGHSGSPGPPCPIERQWAALAALRRESDIPCCTCSPGGDCRPSRGRRNPAGLLGLPHGSLRPAGRQAVTVVPIGRFSRQALIWSWYCAGSAVRNAWRTTAAGTRKTARERAA
jgi:hypothetical protein